MRRLLAGLGLVLTTGVCAQTFYSDNFNDGNADGWLSDQGDWTVESGVYHGRGTYSGGRDDNVSYVPTVGGLNMSVEADLHNDDGFDHVNKVLALRYQNAGNFMYVAFIASWRHWLIVGQVNEGSRSALTPEYANYLPEHGATEWHNCRVDLDDTRVIAYFDSQEVFNKNVAAILVRPGVTGVATYGTSGGGQHDIFVDNYRAGLFDYSAINQITVQPGIITAGSLTSIAERDGVNLQFRPGPVLTSAQAPIQVSFSATTEVLQPTEFRLKLQSGVGANGIRQVVSLYNNETSQYEEVDNRVMPFVDVRLEKIVNVNGARFINQVTGAILGKITMRPTTAVLLYPWIARIDYMAFTSRT